MLSSLAHMRQAPLIQCPLLDSFSSLEDRLIPTEVHIRQRQITQALVVSAMVVVSNEGSDLTFQIAGQEVILKQRPVLHGLMPALDFALGLGMVGHTAHMVHAAFAQPGGKVGRDIRQAVVAQQSQLVDDLGAVAARSLQGQVQRLGDIARFYGDTQLPGDHSARVVIQNG